MSVTKESILDYLYYRNLPEVYRTEDLNQIPIEKPLYRYLKAISDSGFKEVISSVTGILSLVDPKDCPEVFLPYLLRCFGFDYFEDIDPKYQRKLLSNIGELIKRRGTYSGVKYLARVLTGLDVRLILKPEGETPRLTVELLFDTLDQVDNLDNDIKSVERYIGYFVPFWVLPVSVTSSIRVQELKEQNFIGSSMTYYSKYNVVPEGVE